MIYLKDIDSCTLLKKHLDTLTMLLKQVLKNCNGAEEVGNNIVLHITDYEIQIKL